MTRPAALRALIAGFGLVMLLLGAAGLFAVVEGRAIRGSAAAIVHEQILLTRLLHEAQVEEDALALALHRFTEAAGQEERARQLRELDAADQAIARLAAEAAHTPQAGRWRRLAEETGSFTLRARGLLETGPGSSGSGRLEGLFDQHDRVVKLIHDLILESTSHLAGLDDRLGRQLQELARESALLLGACLVLAGMCAAGTIAYVRHSIDQIERQAEELGHVSWHMLQSQEEAARRFSHELHDELGQSLAAVRSNLTRVRSEDPESLRADSVRLVDAAIANVRELSQLLRPVILDDFGLDAGLRWLAEGFSQRTGIRTDCDSALPQRLESRLETHLFRIAQEALTNVARHSGARQVRIQLLQEGEEVVLRIEDDGRGLDPAAPPGRGSLGLVGMRARARECGGGMEIRPAKPSGLALEVRVPCRLAADNGEAAAA